MFLSLLISILCNISTILNSSQSYCKKRSCDISQNCDKIKTEAAARKQSYILEKKVYDKRTVSHTHVWFNPSHRVNNGKRQQTFFCLLIESSSSLHSTPARPHCWPPSFVLFEKSSHFKVKCFFFLGAPSILGTASK